MNNIGSNNQRIIWIDNAKALAMFCVVFGHINGLFNHDIAGFAVLNNFIVSFNMYLFVFLSGYVSVYGLLKITTVNDWVAYVKKMFMRLMIPSLVAHIIDCLIVGHYYKGLGPWFLPFMFKTCICVSFAFLISSYLNGSKYNKYREVVKYTLFLLFMLVASKRETHEFAPIFLFGLMANEYRLIDSIKKYKSFVLCGLLVVFVVFFTISGSYQFYNNSLLELWHNGTPLIFIYRQISAFSAVVFISLFLIDTCKKNSNITQWGKQTLGIYIVHGFMINIYNKWGGQVLSHLPSDIYMWLVALLCSIIIWFISLLMISVIRRNWVSKRLILGE